MTQLYFITEKLLHNSSSKHNANLRSVYILLHLFILLHLLPIKCPHCFVKVDDWMNIFTKYNCTVGMFQSDACVIDGVCYPAYTMNVTNSDEWCIPEKSTTAWSVRTGGCTGICLYPLNSYVSFIS